jgi:hypothetical protein
MRLEIFLVSALILCARARAAAQDSVCDLFKDLNAYDDRQVSVRGELFLDGDRAALGAGPLWRDKDGRTALDLAKESGNQAVEVLKKADRRR